MSRNHWRCPRVILDAPGHSLSIIKKSENRHFLGVLSVMFHMDISSRHGGEYFPLPLPEGVPQVLNELSHGVHNFHVRQMIIIILNELSNAMPNVFLR